jgi:hypothetical protein
MVFLVSTSLTPTHTTLSERRFYVTLTGVRGGEFGGDFGPAIATVTISQRDGVAPSGGSYTPSYFVSIDGRHAFGGVAAHLTPAGIPGGMSGGMIWGDEIIAPTTAPAFRTVEVWVRCLDGEIRHAEAFATKAEARMFAEWGHCCYGTHTLERLVTPVCIVVPGVDGPTLWDCTCDECLALQAQAEDRS